MAKGAAKSWAEQLADLDDPAPRELDPEDAPERIEDGSSSERDDPTDARAHYIDVEKSKLRKKNETTRELGARYAGSTISRDALGNDDEEDNPFASQDEKQLTDDEQYADPDVDLAYMEVDEDEEIDSDEAFESGDEDNFQGFKFRGSRAPVQDQGFDEEGDDLDVESEGENVDPPEEEFNGVDSDSEGDDDEDDVADHKAQDDTESSDDSNSDETSISEEPDKPGEDDRAALRKMMAEDPKSAAATLSKAAKADVEKGRAIKTQRTTFDKLLNTRIKLQKALIATNSMSANTTSSAEHTETIQAAETAALNLWNNLSSLRSFLEAPNNKKRSFSATSSTLSSSLWDHMQTQEETSIPNRRANLTKWSQKTNPTAVLPRTNKFSQTPTHQPLTSVLDQHLSGTNLEKLIYKTKTPRSCAPTQAAARITEDPTIYDDADFYTLLLRELVDQRMADSTQPGGTVPNGIAPLPDRRDVFKVKKQVDTKASKGRKMRYTVHEKLQNFMAPDDRGTWGERQRNELFGSLLGRKVRLGEVDGVESEEDGGEDMEGVEAGLRLFG